MFGHLARRIWHEHFLVVLMLALAPAVFADVELTSPASGASLAGGAVTLEWKDSGALPALAAISVADIILCTGTDAAPQLLDTLAGSVPMGTTTSLAVTIPLTIGTNGQYFIKFVETTAAGSVVTTYSDRFTLTSMTGTTVANTGLAASGPAGTTPAAALLESAAATASNANTATTVASAELAAWATQTGETRSAPPQSKPGSKITANPKSPQALFPSSAYTLYTVAGAAPVAVTTLTASPTWTVTSLSNGAAAASTA